MKKILIAILAMCLMLALAACGGGESGAQTGNGVNSEHMHCVCNGKAVGVGAHTACSEKDGWLEISTAQELLDVIASSAAKPAFVTLSADITIDGYLEIGESKQVNICLNGKKLNAATHVLGKLNITDCTDAGAWTSQKAFTIKTYSGAVVNAYGGTITTTGSASDTQVVVLDGSASEELQLPENESEFTVYNGKIQAVGKTTKQGHSVYIGVYGILKMYNGTICNGCVETTDAAARYAGNIAIWGINSAFYMYGGEVKNGTVVQPEGTNSDGGCGGNIAVFRGDLGIYGGTVSGGRSNGYGGNIGTNNKPGVMVFKDCVIKDGVAEGQNGGNIYINGNSGTDKTVSFENVTISGGNSQGNGGNVFINASDLVTFRECTISGGKSTYGAGITIQGKKFLVELKGNMKFSDNQESDIYMLSYKGDHSWLSVAELTTTTPVVVGSKVNMEFTVDTALNHPFVAIEGMNITEVDGKLLISKNQ